MVEGARAEHRSESRGVHRDRETGTRALRQRDERHPGCDCCEERVLVEETPEAGSGRQLHREIVPVSFGERRSLRPSDEAP